MKIRIVNWKKHNHKRSDGRKYSWFKLQNDFILSSECFRLDAHEVKIWLYLLSLASSQNTDEPQWDASHMSVVLQCASSDIPVALKKFKDFGWIDTFRRPVGNPGGSPRIEQNRIEKKEIYKESIEPIGSHPNEFGMDHPLVELWNTKSNAGLPKVKTVGRKRARQLAAAWKEFGPEHWLAAIVAGNGLPFYNGDNDRKWKMDFDYFIREGVSTKLIEQFESNKLKQEKQEKHYDDGRYEFKDF